MLTRMLRWRYLLLVGWSTAWMAPQYLHYRNQLSDFDVFLYGGRAMIGHIAGYHGGLHTYADHSELQIGPLPLFLAGALSYLPGESGQLVWLSLIFVCGFVSVRALEVLATRLGWSPRSSALLSLLAGGAILAAWTQLGFYFHLEEAAAIALVLIAVVVISSDGRWATPAALIGTAAMCKPWAIATLPLLLRLERPDRLKAILLGVASAVVWWLPFVVADTRTVSALGSLANGVMPHSTLRVFGFGIRHGGPKEVRLLEIALGAALACWAMIRGRWLAVPLLVLIARLGLEPRWYTYYVAALMCAALLWDLAEGRRFPVTMVLVGVLELVVQLWLPSALGVAAHVVLIVFVAASLVASVKRSPTLPRRRSPAPAALR